VTELEDMVQYVVSVVPGQPVDTQVTVFIKHKSLPSDLTLTVLATYYTNAGQFSFLADHR